MKKKWKRNKKGKIKRNKRKYSEQTLKQHNPKQTEIATMLNQKQQQQ